MLIDHQTQLRIRDLVEHGDEVVIAQGGKGGVGNGYGGAARPPMAGQQVEVQIILKIPSDLVLIGLPNSGKSTLLNRLTRANAKVETYAFSTQSPQLGVFIFDDSKRLVLCELPGLLEGSSKGKGIGNKFLRHALRTKFLLLLIDPFNSFRYDPVKTYRLLLDELACYDKELLNLPRLVAVNRCDEPGFEERTRHFKKSAKDKVFYISALRGDGIEKLKLELGTRV